MNRTPPTIDELKATGRHFLEAAKEQLTTTKNMIPVIYLCDAADGEPNAMIAVDGTMMNDPHSKDALSAGIKARIAKHAYSSVVSVMDTWALFVPKEHQEKYHIVRGIFGEIPNKVMAEVFGVGTVQETIFVMVQTIMKTVIIKVPYERDPSGSVVSFGEMSESEEGEVTGRFSYFTHQ